MLWNLCTESICFVFWTWEYTCYRIVLVNMLRRGNVNPWHVCAFKAGATGYVRLIGGATLYTLFQIKSTTIVHNILIMLFIRILFWKQAEVSVFLITASKNLRKLEWKCRNRRYFVKLKMYLESIWSLSCQKKVLKNLINDMFTILEQEVQQLFGGKFFMDSLSVAWHTTCGWNFRKSLLLPAVSTASSFYAKLS